MTKKLARNILYIFLLINIAWLLYFSFTDHNFINIEHIRDYLQWPHLVIALLLYVFFLTLRWLTLFPGTPLLFAGVLIFPKLYVIVAVEIAIFLYTLIIYKYSKLLDFQIPKKLMDFKPKKERWQLLYIMSLCFIPGISMNGLAYYLSIQKIDLKNILLWMWLGTIITTTMYIHGIALLVNISL